MSKQKPHVTHNSQEENWYTPAVYIESARRVFGGRIDLDPASSQAANEIVRADVYYTKEDNGLLKRWYGNVWLNPPYTRGLVDAFLAKLNDEFSRKDGVQQAIVLVNNATETEWFQKLSMVASALSFPRKRIKFWSPVRETSSPLQGQAFVYLGYNPDAFICEFKKYGIVCLISR